MKYLFPIKISIDKIGFKLQIETLTYCWKKSNRYISQANAFF